MAQVKAGKYKLNLRQFPVHTLIEDVKKTMCVIVKHSNDNLALVSHIDPLVTDLVSDALRIKQILINLVSKYTHSPPLLLNIYPQRTR